VRANTEADRSYASAGAHLLRIHTPGRRLSAGEVAQRLTGMCLLALATVTADCRPVVGPVDGVSYGGAFYFGSSPDSIRFRHIRARPQVSATHLPGEERAVTVHGRAVPIDVQHERNAGFRRALLEIYVPATARSGRSSWTRVRCMRGSTPTGCSPSRCRRAREATGRARNVSDRTRHRDVLLRWWARYETRSSRSGRHRWCDQPPVQQSMIVAATLIAMSARL